MDLNLTPTEQTFREFRAWLRDNVPAPWTGGAGEDREEFNAYLRTWQRTLFEGGWAGISWPKEFGGRGGFLEQAIFQEEPGWRMRLISSARSVCARRADDHRHGFRGTESAVSANDPVR